MLENSKVENLMGIEKLVNIWRPCSRLEFRSNHAQFFLLESMILVDQVKKQSRLKLWFVSSFALFFEFFKDLN